jgi:hypothetical protein
MQPSIIIMKNAYSDTGKLAVIARFAPPAFAITENQPIGARTATAIALR